ncbi:unnamed protein product [Lactuca saligna]|uniref:Uncharacterized protein n=1 Tax=Lactuca saligna TaxID=75948 RepID=A0AA36EEW9_LACSI|nr:unnamed protein product [Lactuca saligna]
MNRRTEKSEGWFVGLNGRCDEMRGPLLRWSNQTTTASPVMRHPTAVQEGWCDEATTRRWWRHQRSWSASDAWTEERKKTEGWFVGLIGRCDEMRGPLLRWSNQTTTASPVMRHPTAVQEGWCDEATTRRWWRHVSGRGYSGCSGKKQTRRYLRKKTRMAARSDGGRHLGKKLERL